MPSNALHLLLGFPKEPAHYTQFWGQHACKLLGLRQGGTMPGSPAFRASVLRSDRLRSLLTTLLGRGVVGERWGTGELGHPVTMTVALIYPLIPIGQWG